MFQPDGFTLDWKCVYLTALGLVCHWPAPNSLKTPQLLMGCPGFKTLSENTNQVLAGQVYVGWLNIFFFLFFFLSLNLSSGDLWDSFCNFYEISINKFACFISGEGGFSPFTWANQTQRCSHASKWLDVFDKVNKTHVQPTQAHQMHTKTAEIVHLHHVYCVYFKVK